MVGICTFEKYNVQNVSLDIIHELQALRIEETLAFCNCFSHFFHINKFHKLSPSILYLYYLNVEGMILLFAVVCIRMRDNKTIIGLT